MTLQERIENERMVNRPVIGTFQTKPEDAKTLRQWLREGMCPKEGTTLHMYQMTKKNPYEQPEGYGYYDAKDVRPLTRDEQTWYESTLKVKRSESPKQQEQKTTTQKPQKSLKDQLLRGKMCHIVTPEEWETKEIVVFDTETTGFGKYDEILQLSAADNHGHTYDQYVQPLRKKRWDEAEAINHISPAMVKGQPTTVTLAPIWQSLFDQADYIIGHNVSFDIRMTGYIGIRIDPSKVIDTMNIHKIMAPDAEKHKLETAVAEFASESIKAQYADGAHSAIVDVLATLDVYHTFCKQVWEME